MLYNMSQCQKMLNEREIQLLFYSVNYVWLMVNSVHGNGNIFFVVYYLLS